MFNAQEIIWILEWWLTWFALGLIFVPTTFLIFSQFHDKGYIFSKVLAIGIISYLVLVVNMFHLLPFTRLSIIFTLWLGLLFNIYLFRKYKITSALSRWKFFVFEEVLFLLCLALWVYIRAHEPSINGLEKFMDFGFINSILRTTWQPAVDMWFPPLPINYYYFGHLITAILTKVSSIPSYITYNLMLATIFSLTFSLAFSLGLNILFKIVNLRKAIIGGFIIATLVSLSGNLHTIYSFFTGYNAENPIPFWNLVLSPLSFPNNYWYPNATRFIPLTIHEFPLYSFVVSDLHGHVIDIPFVLLTIALCYSLIQNSKFAVFKFVPKLFTFSLLTLLALMLAIMYMTNAWDGMIYMMLAAFVFMFIQIKKNSNITNFAIEVLKLSLPLFLLFLIFSLPFNLNFDPFVHGIGILCTPKLLANIGNIGPILFEKDHCQRSTWWQLLILYGFFYFFVISFLIFLFKFSKINPFNKLRVVASQSRSIKNLKYSDIFILLLILLSTLLIIVPEFIYLKDIYPAHYRANTMFKLVYQSFIMLSISSGYIIVRLISNFKREKRFNLRLVVFICIGSIGLFLVGIYPYLAIKSYYGDLKTFSGLDGIAYIKTTAPDDYKAILWLNDNISGRPVILEAQGDSYTDYGRISANTGLPTILGWTVHEWLWRGSYDIPAPRIEDVQKIYESDDIKQTKSLLKKYNVEYVYLGDLERQKYPNIKGSKFEELGKIVFLRNQTKIYKLNP